MDSTAFEASPPALAPDVHALGDLAVMWDNGTYSTLSALQHGLQEALAQRGVRVVNRQRSEITRQIARVLSKLRLVRAALPRGDRRSLTVLSWASEVRAFPDCYWRQLVPWIFDCWEPDFGRWEALLKRQRIRTAFFSARSAAEHFARRLPGLHAVWVPEACDPSAYSPGRPLADRAIKVMEIGRRWAQLHERIRAPLERQGLRHVYDIDVAAKRLYSRPQDLYAAFGDSTVMLCFPKSLTHPTQAGRVETLTQRYLEAIGSGSIPVGHAPQEIVDLFGFNPVVELSMSDPAGHLASIVAHATEYEEFTARSLARLRQVGTFSDRAQRILTALAS